MKLVAVSTLTPDELADVQQIYFDGFEPHLRASFDDLLADTAFVLVDSRPLGLAVLRSSATPAGSTCATSPWGKGPGPG